MPCHDSVEVIDESRDESWVSEAIIIEGVLKPLLTPRAQSSSSRPLS
jgi:hypothetical protein